MIWTLLMACTNANLANGDSAILEEACIDTNSKRYFVMEEILFTRRTENQVWGFDLDNMDSHQNDPAGCFKEDLIDPEGNSGIDNAFSGLMPLLDQTEAVAAEGLIQNAINSGEVLLIIEIGGMNNEESDPCVDLNILRGEGVPILGANGKLLDNQSFELQADSTTREALETELLEGKIIAKPLSMTMPVNVLSESLLFEMHNGGIVVNLEADGTAHGFFGGAIPLQTLLSAVDFEQIDGTEFFMGLLEGSADLEPNAAGECQAMSVAFEFKAQPAFVFSNENAD